MIKAGYHYTTKSHWDKIKNEGLQPYLIHKPELKKYGFEDFYGIWIWKVKPRGKAHAGCIIYQTATKGEENVVFMQVRYDDKDLLRPDFFQSMTVFHDGRIENWRYHDAQNSMCEGVIITKPVFPKDIKVIKQYNIIEALK